jgi:hypothetical protein
MGKLIAVFVQKKREIQLDFEQIDGLGQVA